MEEELGARASHITARGWCELSDRASSDDLAMRPAAATPKRLFRQAHERYVPPSTRTVVLSSDATFTFGVKPAFGMAFCDPGQFAAAFSAEGLSQLVAEKADSLVRDLKISRPVLLLLRRVRECRSLDASQH